MSRDDTAARVTRILVDQLGVELEKVQADVRLIPEDHASHHWSDSGGGPNDLGADSLDVVELVMAIEDEFRIEIPDDEAEKLNAATVGQLIDFVHARVDAQS